MTFPMPRQTLDQALTLTPGDGPDRTADLTADFSNAPLAWPADKGAPFGGLMAALAVRAMREGLDIQPPLMTLTVQYLAAARFAPVTFSPTLERGGRSVAYASVRAGQPGPPALTALGTFGTLGHGPEVRPLTPSPTPFEDLDPTPVDPQLAPWFTRYIEHRFDGGAKIGGGSPLSDPTLRLWMRTIDHRPLDELSLCFLLDGIFPSYMTVLPVPPVPSASVDLRYDLIEPVTPDTSPEGWAIFQFRTRDVSGGWALDDGMAFAPDGRPLALARQRRKLFGPRRPAEA